MQGYTKGMAAQLSPVLMLTHLFLQCRYLQKDSPKSKKEGKDQESIQSSTTPDPGYQWESDNL